MKYKDAWHEDSSLSMCRRFYKKIKRVRRRLRRLFPPQILANGMCSVTDDKARLIGHRLDWLKLQFFYLDEVIAFADQY